MTLEEALGRIQPADQEAMEAARRKWSTVAKPLNSLGVLEENITRMAGVFGTPEFTFGKKAVLVMCADNGVVEEGVTQTGQEATAVVAENMTRGESCVCQMAKVAGAQVFPVDVGIARPVEGVVQRCVRRGGTRNMTKESAMTKEEAAAAICVGIDLVGELKEQGYGLIATGEMGIGNTTTSSALVSVFLDKPVEEVTGRGAGLSTEGLRRKVSAIERAIALHRPDPADGLDVLSKVGGLDIAAIAGTFLGGAVHHVPILVDGLISAAAAMAAIRICPAVKDYIFATHVSKEPAGELVLEALGLKPFIYGEMCLGEGTGAVAAMPLLEMGLTVYRGMLVFDEAGFGTYTPQV